jgi:hypothetical protein
MVMYGAGFTHRTAHASHRLCVHGPMLPQAGARAGMQYRAAGNRAPVEELSDAVGHALGIGRTRPYFLVFKPAYTRRRERGGECVCVCARARARVEIEQWEHTRAC